MDTHLASAIDRVARLLSSAADPYPPFPPTELFSEGWMLRLVMESQLSGNGGLPIPVVQGTSWYSEARLSSPFQPSRRGDPHGETHTHADGVIGHATMRSGTTAGLTLPSDATEFAVIEAKMGSKLAAGTTRVPWYDQAARTVAAMAWTLWESDLTPDMFESLAFIVVAPQDRVLTDRTFASCANKPSIADKVQRRIDLYSDDAPTRHQQLETFYKRLFMPFMEKMQLFLISWENIIDWTEPAAAEQLQAFYRRCLHYNGLQP